MKIWFPVLLCLRQTTLKHCLNEFTEPREGKAYCSLGVLQWSFPGIDLTFMVLLSTAFLQAGGGL